MQWPVLPSSPDAAILGCARSTSVDHLAAHRLRTTALQYGTKGTILCASTQKSVPLYSIGLTPWKVCTGLQLKCCFDTVLFPKRVPAFRKLGGLGLFSPPLPLPFLQVLNSYFPSLKATGRKGGEKELGVLVQRGVKSVKKTAMKNRVGKNCKSLIFPLQTPLPPTCTSVSEQTFFVSCSSVQIDPPKQQEPKKSVLEKDKGSDARSGWTGVTDQNDILAPKMDSLFKHSSKKTDRHGLGKR